MYIRQTAIPRSILMVVTVPIVSVLRGCSHYFVCPCFQSLPFQRKAMSLETFIDKTTAALFSSCRRSKLGSLDLG